MKRKARFVFFLVSLMTMMSCSLLAPTLEDPEDSDSDITGISFSTNNLTLGVGGIEYVEVSISPSDQQKNAKIVYKYDADYLTLDGDNSGFTVIANKTGQKTVKATCNGYSTTCIVTISGTDASVEQSPQITSSTIALELENQTSKQVQVSLTGGSASDMSNFTWYIDKSDIATIEGSGQTAYITAKQNGVAQVTVTHPLATYPYRFTVFVKPDAEKAQYITTTQNILSLERSEGEQQISVSLMNGEDSDLPFFTWEKITSDESDPDCITIESNGQNCIITPLEQGTTLLQVSHPKTIYPLIIRVRVITVINNVYIEPEKTTVTLEGLNPQTISACLKGSDEATDNSNGEFTWSIDEPDIVDITPYENNCGLRGLKNGKAKITITHPLAKYSREILVFVENHPSDAIDGAMYLTTAQNYIRTKIGAEDTILNISLAGGSDTDKDDFDWSVDDSDILGLSTANGTVSSRSLSASRSLFTSYGDATASITPKAVGTAIITVTHPKALSPLNIMVKVYDKNTLLEDPTYITGTSLIKIIKGESTDCDIGLYGNTTTNDEDNLVWTTEPAQNIIKVVAAGTNANITAKECGQTYIKISHPNAESDKKIVVVSANTQEELDTFKLLYAQKYDYNILEGATSNIYLETGGLSSEEIQNITWTTSDSSIVTIDAETTKAVITGISTGEATITATSPDCTESVYFTITVYPEGTDMGVIPSPVYLTTEKNVFQLDTIGDDATAYITPVGISVNEFQNITYTIEDDSICSLITNGDKATITAKKEGSTTIKVEHPEAENYLTLSVRVGERYISDTTAIPYIQTSQDVIGLVCNKTGEKVTATIKNYDGEQDLDWSIDNTDIATITPCNSYCYIEPKNPGQAQITITNQTLGCTKHILVLVANSEEDLSNIPYLTTAQNIILLKKDNQQNVSVNIVNNDGQASTYNWKNVDNNGVVEIIQSGNVASISGIETGLAHIQITNTACVYPLEIVVQVEDSLPDATNSPYITTNNNIITLNDNSASKLINVTLVGGSDTDNKNFVWNYDSSNVIVMVPNGNNCYIKPVKAGECCITVSHCKAEYTLPIKVIVQESSTENSLYIKTSPSNIITLKPGDSETTITASLVGGSEADDFGFTWYSDNYNCIDFTANANTAIITPKAEGNATITVKHPKAGFPAEIQVRITEYSEFEFATSNMTMTEGTTQFVSMHVPSIDSSYDGKVIYQTDNPKVVTISGTNEVSQITAVAAGTAILTATSPSGSKSTLMVYVKKSDEATLPYITSSTNVLSMDVEDNEKSISAQIVGSGISSQDQYNLEWSIDNPSVAKLIGTTGSDILLRPLAAGETTVTISHSKTDSIYTIHIEVIGSENGITINKSYVSLNTGKSEELEANIDRGSTEDYSNITWSAEKVDGVEIVNILGSGQTVALYALATGETTVTAQYNGKTATCDVMVTPSKQFYFDTKSVKVQPGEKKVCKYTVYPEDSDISWVTNSNDYIEIQDDKAAQELTITGTDVGSTQLIGRCDTMTAQLSITTTWDYNFSIVQTTIQGSPDKKYSINYTVNPANAVITASSSSIADVNIIATGEGNGYIEFSPKAEGSDTIVVNAENPNDNNYAFESKTINLNLIYDNITITPVVDLRNGKFSTYDSAIGTIKVTDGEDITLGFKAEQKNANWSFDSCIFTPTANSVITMVDDNTLVDECKLDGGADYIEYNYKTDFLLSFEVCNNDESISYGDVDTLEFELLTSNTERDGHPCDIYISKKLGTIKVYSYKSGSTASGNIYEYSCPIFVKWYKYLGGYIPAEKHPEEIFSVSNNDLYDICTKSYYYTNVSIISTSSNKNLNDLSSFNKDHVKDGLSNANIHLKYMYTNLLYTYYFTAKDKETINDKNVPFLKFNDRTDRVPSTDETLKDHYKGGVLTIKYKHNGKYETFEIPVNYEQRPCEKTVE